MPQRRATYVLRLWANREPSDSEMPAVRGSLQLVDKETARHFASLEQLIDLLRSAVDELTQIDHG